MHIHSIDLCLSSLTGRSLLSSPKLADDDDDDDIALQSNETYMEMSSGLLKDTVDSNVNQNILETLSGDLHLSDSSTTTSSSSEEEEEEKEEPYTDDVIIPGRSNKRKLKDITEEKEEDEIKKNRKYWHMDLDPNSEHDRLFWNIIHGEDDIMARLMTKEDYQKYVHEAIGWID